MRNTLINMAVAVTGLTLLAGCGDSGAGSGAGSAPAAGADGATPPVTGALSEEATKRQAAEKLIADCMKKKGFPYEVPPPLETNARSAGFSGPSSLLKTDDEVRQYRQRYGFGIYSAVLFPDDPMVRQPEINPANNPNNRIRAALDPARQKAWDAALGSDVKEGRSEPGCSDDAYQKVFGAADPDPQRQQAKLKREYERYRTDPAVVAAAGEYAACLREKGYQVASTEPGRIDTGVYDLINAPVRDGGPVGAAEAKTRLAEEIKAALADVDCRGDYATLARTKYAKVVTHGGGAG